MNRVIKFRAWDGKEMFLSPAEIQFLGSWFDAHAPGALYKGGTVFMQYTGLHDKKGKEIYEGDIISFQNRMYEVMINFNGYYLQRYKLWNGKFKPAFQYSMSLITKPAKDRSGGEVESAEVIGNIYENPELVSRIHQPPLHLKSNTMTLFNIPPANPPKPTNRCKNCIHMYQHEYNKTKYCRKQKGKNTAYGHKKIKANDPACPMFEKIH